MCLGGYFEQGRQDTGDIDNFSDYTGVMANIPLKPPMTKIIPSNTTDAKLLRCAPISFTGNHLLLEVIVGQNFSTEISISKRLRVTLIYLIG